MTACEILEEIRGRGIRIEAHGEKLRIAPMGIVSPGLKAEMAKHKAELLTLLRMKPGKSDDMQTSMHRLEDLDIRIAVLDTGEMRVIQTNADAHGAINDGFTVYTARDMYEYITLGDRERCLLHSFKKRFGGITEWRTSR